MSANTAALLYAAAAFTLALWFRHRARRNARRGR